MAWCLVMQKHTYQEFVRLQLPLTATSRTQLRSKALRLDKPAHDILAKLKTLPKLPSTSDGSVGTHRQESLNLLQNGLTSLIKIETAIMTPQTIAHRLMDNVSTNKTAVLPLSRDIVRSSKRVISPSLKPFTIPPD